MPNTIRVPYSDYREYPPEEMLDRADKFYTEVMRRRSVRHFSDRRVDVRVIERCILAASTAPNGANLQPWHFVVITSPDIKRRVRAAAEAEEREFYTRRAPQEWLDALAPLGTDSEKPFLETAPYLIAVFAQPYRQLANNEKQKHYYVTESVGIATGMLITALHFSGLATLTHTPSPMNFLTEICGRPNHERPFVLVVTGYPVADVTVPVITKKPLTEIATFL